MEGLLSNNLLSEATFFDYPASHVIWTPPSDWINIDDCAAGNINLLVADTTLATYAFVCTTSFGQYQVDWGDGTNENFDSGATAQHSYTLGTGQACSRGYTTFKIVISPVSGDLTSFAVTSHSLATQNQYFDILSCVCRATSLTTLAQAFNKTFSIPVYCVALESFRTIGTFSFCTNASYMFSGCCALQNISMGGTTAITNASHMFDGCNSLRSIDASHLSAVIDASGMFRYCYALQRVDVSNMTAVTNAMDMFNCCLSLQKIDVSSMKAVTNAREMFNNCYSLQSVSINMPTVVYTSYMFRGCYALQNVDVSSMKVVTTAFGMFSSCYNLRSINISNMTAITSASHMFQDCYTLKSIDINNMTAVTDASYMFYNCHSLAVLNATNFAINAAYVNCYSMFKYCEQLVNIEIPNAKVTNLTAGGGSGKINKLETLIFHASSTFSDIMGPQLDIQYNTLTAAQLDTIFASLPTVTSKTVNIAGCTGAASCNKSIATAKGWGVTEEEFF